MKKSFLCSLLFFSSVCIGQEKLEPCTGHSGVWDACIGTFNYSNRTYVGTWQNGKRSGYGEITFFEGSKFIGQFDDDQPNGQGTYIFADGRRYVGKFKSGKYDGQGTFTFADGGQYVGEFRVGQVTGQGVYTFADGRRYAGEFKNWKYDGRGTFTYANGDQHVGEYRDGLRTGQGTYTFANGDQYLGEYWDGQQNGQGIYTFSDGRKYIGEFKNNTQTGNGRYEGNGWTDYAGQVLESNKTKFWYARKIDRAQLLFQQRKFKEALPLLIQLARSNNPRAQGLLAGMYLNGLGTNIELNSAYKWAQEGSNRNDPIAQNVLASMYRTGKGVERNLKYAFSWYKKSAENGNDDAQLKIAFGHIYKIGDGKNILDGLEYLQAAAQKGNPTAMTALADEYYYGKNLTQNYPVAKHWYELAAKKLDTYSTIQLAEIYLHGNGVPIDTDKAIKLYEVAAQKNNRYALIKLGKIYENGLKVEVNPELAYEYYSKLAKLNDATGQLKLALNILNDSKVLNKDDAKNLLLSSAKKGNKIAKLQLIDIYSNYESGIPLNSNKFKEIKNIANKYNINNYGYDNLKDVINSSLVKKSIAFLATPVERDENFDMTANYDKEFKFIYDGLEKEIKLSSALKDTQEKRDTLQTIIYKLDDIYNFAWEARKLQNVDERNKSREKLLLEIKSFSEYLIITYPKNHPLHAQGYQLLAQPYLNLNLSGKAEKLKNIIDYQKTDTFFASLVSDENLNDDELCHRYIDHIIYIAFMKYIIAYGQEDKKNYANLALEYLLDSTLGVKQCLNLEIKNRIYFTVDSLKTITEDSDLREFIALANVKKLKLNGESNFKQQYAYILLLGEQGNYEKKRRYLKSLVEEVLSSEGTIFEQEALLFSKNPTEYLIPQYLLNEQYQLAQEAIVRAIKYSLINKYNADKASSTLKLADQHSYSPDLLLNLSETLPEQKATQKIFLLKKAFELDRLNNSFMVNLKDDEILGRFDLYNRKIERNLIDLLLSQNRQIEAELFIKYLKIDEISELLRDQKIKEDFVLPSWFYNPEEKNLNKNYTFFLNNAQSVFKVIGPIDFIKEKLIDKESVNQLNKFTNFLITGENTDFLVNVTSSNSEFILMKDESQDLLAKLPKHTALVQYIIGKNYLYINLNLPNKKVTKKITISSKDLIGKIFQFRLALANRVSSTELGHELYSVLIKPIEGDFIQDNTFQVMLSLDGALRYLPFAALHNGKAHLISKYNFTIFDNINTSNFFSGNNKWEVAGFGVTKALNGFTALPAVKEEITAIVQTNNMGIFPGTINLDDNFTLKELQGSINKKFPVFHIATHFKFSPGAATQSYLQLGDGSTLNLIDFKKLSLSGVDLITFSACQTGLGGGLGEDGVEIAGLSYLAQRNGAKTVIASLWSVSDKSTALLMSKMYGYIANNNFSKSKALRNAQIDLMESKDFSEPFYWAPFGLYGNWQ
jgi:CHAT domain-containing protein/TPR repeat protein